MAVPFNVFTHMVEEHFPLSCAYSWDNSGAVIKLSDEVSGVLIALDLTEGVLDEADKKGFNLILTHHPPIFNAVKRLTSEDPVTSAVLKSVKLGISVYSAHTSCDCAPNGLNFELGRTIGLDCMRIFAQDGCEFPGGGLGVCGELGGMLSESEVVELVKKNLGLKMVRCSNVRGSFGKAAVIGGSGGEFYAEAARQGIRVLITGEAKHNEFVEASECGVLLIEAGHYETERVFMPLVRRILNKSITDRGIALEVEIAQEGIISAFVQ